MDKIDNLDINTLSDNDKGVYIEDIKTKGVYIEDELIASTDFDWMKLFPSLTNNLVDKSLRDVNGCAILNFSSLRIYKRDDGIYHNYYYEPHTLNWFTVNGPDLADYKGFNVVVLLFDYKP